MVYPKWFSLLQLQFELGLRRGLRCQSLRHYISICKGVSAMKSILEVSSWMDSEVGFFACIFDRGRNERESVVQYRALTVDQIGY